MIAAVSVVFSQLSTLYFVSWIDHSLPSNFVISRHMLVVMQCN